MSTPDLRTRIIAVIAKADQDWVSDNPLHEDMADAVIRAVSDYRREVSEDDFLDALSEADDE